MTPLNTPVFSVNPGHLLYYSREQDRAFALMRPGGDE